jgi:hypothetical protein
MSLHLPPATKYNYLNFNYSFRASSPRQMAHNISRIRWSRSKNDNDNDTAKSYSFEPALVLNWH